MEKDVEKCVKMNLVFEVIVEVENIELMEEVIDEEIFILVEKYGMEKDVVCVVFGDMSEFKFDFKICKVIDVLLDSVVEK